MDHDKTSSDLPEWVDYRSAAALTGMSRTDLAWAIADGLVAFTTDRPGHEGVPMLRLHDVQAVAAAPDRARDLREPTTRRDFSPHAYVVSDPA